MSRRMLFALTLWFGCAGALAAAEGPGGVKNVVLVHGGFVDGSGWEEVYDALKKDGYESPSFRIRRSLWPTTWR